MRLRHPYVIAALLLGIAVAVIPAIASSETPPSISAYTEPGGYGYHSWKPSTATIGAGGAVQFSNPESVVPHGLKFTSTPEGATPNCTGIPAAAKEASGATNWHGECTFTTPGTYSFVCTVHSEMTGTITVNPNGTTTTTTTTPTTTTTTTPTTTTPTSTPTQGKPSGSPLVGGLSLRSSQSGGSIKGALDISKAGAGDTLRVDVSATKASLAKRKHATTVTVGHFLRGSVSAGKLSFVVKLSAKARQALRRHHRLVLTVKITLTPVYGEPVTITRTVTQRS